MSLTSNVQNLDPVSSSVGSIDRVVLISDFAQNKGGASALVILLARQLADRGMRVTLISGDDGINCGPDDHLINSVALKSASLLERRPFVAAVEGLYNPGAARFLARWINENDTPGTIYHLHNWSHILSPSIFRSLDPVSLRTVIHAHDYFLVCPNGAFTDYNNGSDCPLVPMSGACIRTNCDKRNFAHKLWRVARQQLRQAFWDLSDFATNILVLHDGMSEKFVRSGVSPTRVHVVRNPSVPFTRDRIRAENNREFVFIGRVDEEKGVEDFVIAARAAGVPGRIIGDGNLYSELSLKYQDMQFDGWRNRSEIENLIASARMLVVPSRYPEPFGLVISEALSSGLPVILTDKALLSSEVTQYKIGIACNTRSMQDLSEIIRRMKDDDTAVEAMSREAFRLKDVLAVDPVTWSDQIITFYNSLLKRG